MNILLAIALVIFVCIIAWFYILFITNSVTEIKKEEKKEIVREEPLEKCQRLFDEGLYLELQRYAQRELSKNYSNVELRRILAKSYLETNDEQSAIMHFEAILNINSDPETQEFLAKYYSENGPQKRAIELYEQILLYDNGNFNAVEMLAKLYEELPDYEKALNMHLLILDAEVDENRKVELEYAIADLYLKIGDNEKAFDAYSKISKEDPENLEVLIILADLAYKNRFWKDCLKYYEKIISIVGDDFEILEKIAQLYVTLEDWTNATDAYKKIISLEGKESANYLYHQNELCNAMLKNGNSNQAIELLKDLISQNPKETSFLFTLAQAYTLVGQYQTGINLYNKLLEVLPTEQSEMIIKYISSLICAWAQSLFKKGEYNQAFDKFFEALKYNEENDEVYYELGRCNYYIKSFQDSIAHFKRAISIKPQESMYYFGLGCAYDEIGSTKNAKMAFYDAININPMNTQARIAYAISLTKELEYAQSIEQFNEVLKYIPNNADTLYNLALAYDLVGDAERAIRYYKYAIDNDKNHKEALHNIELLLGEPYNPNDFEYVDDNQNNEQNSTQTQEELKEEPEIIEEEIFEISQENNDMENDDSSSMFS